MPSIINASSTGSGGIVQTADASGVLQLQANGTVALATDTSANVGIGVTPSAWSGFRALQIGGTTSLWSSTSGNSSSFYTNNGYFNGSNRIYLTNGFATEYIQGSGQHIWFTAPSGTANNAITFTQAMTLNANGALALQGASTSANGVGITFPATQSASSNANTLDDYEEGEWTPLLLRLSVDPTITFGDRRGRYVKIGSMVYCMAFLSISSISANGSGLNQLGGLPFVAEGAGSSRWVLNLGLNECLTSTDTGYIIANATFGFFYNLSIQSNPNANFTTGQMYVSFSYQTT
jgi:hypothetical protein